MIRTVSLPRARLGQPRDDVFRVVVVDIRGNPFRDARVSISSGGKPLYDVSTGSGGEASAPVEGPVDVRVDTDRYSVVRRGVRTDETLFVTLPVCAPAPIVSGTELGLFALAGAMAWSGKRWKSGLLQIGGEVLFGAVVFTAVYRNACAT